jgi:hypothetical protein
LRLRGPFLIEVAAEFVGHEGEGLRRIAVEAAKQVGKIEAAENRASSAVSPARAAERRNLMARLRALQAEARDCPDGATKAAAAQARLALQPFFRRLDRIRRRNFPPRSKVG